MGLALSGIGCPGLSRPAFFRATLEPVIPFTEQPLFKSLVRVLSPDLANVCARLDGISVELETLPSIPPPSGGGTTGYLSDPENDIGKPSWVKFTFPEPRKIDAFACVPARQPRNYLANEALSLAARLDVILMLKGRAIRRFSLETQIRNRGLRGTLPFFHEFDPVEVDAVRIEDPQEPGGTRNFAIGEIFIFSGVEPVAHATAVTASSSKRGIPGVDIDYIKDGQTALGLPEILETHRYVGYRSQPKPSADFPITIGLDWKHSQRIDEVRLYPVGRLLGVATDAAGFPPGAELDYWSADQGKWMALVRKSGEEMESPGWNPVALRFGEVETNRIRLVFPKLWKATKRSAAILALSEIEPRFRGAPLPTFNLSISNSPQDGGAAPDPDGTPRFWGLAGLTDGMTSDGRIIGEREWMRGLARRANLLITQAHLLREKAALGNDLDRWISRAVLGFLFLLLTLPLALVIRIRRKYLRQMNDVRNRLAADLHDDLGSNLSAISIYGQRLRRQLESPPECLDPMQRLIRESLGSLKEMVSFTTPQISRPISLVDRLREIAEIHCGDTPHLFEVESGLENIAVSSAHRRSLRLFLKEAVHNVVRHSGSPRIDFNLRRETRGEIWLSIRDHGSGLPDEVLQKQTSLPTLRLRAQEMDAAFRASNTPGGGCEVSVSIKPAS